MKAFGQFLVDQGLVPAGAMLEAYLAQLAGQSPMAAVVHRERLLSEAEQLQVLELQSRDGLGYRQALAELGHWKEPLVAKLLAAVEREAVPLGELLVRSGALTVEALNRAFDEYVAAARDVSPPVAAARGVSSPVAALRDVDRPNAPLPAAGPKRVDDVSPGTGGRDAGGLRHGMVASFLQLFDEHRYRILDAMIVAWASDAPATLGEGMLAVLGEWEAIRAGASFVASGDIAELLEAAHTSWQRILPQVTAMRPDEVAELVVSAREVTRVCWDLRARIKAPADEDADERSALDQRKIAILAAVRNLQVG